MHFFATRLYLFQIHIHRPFTSRAKSVVEVVVAVLLAIEAYDIAGTVRFNFCYII